MAHDNIDKHIKEKLEQRAIQPSSEAWDKLSNMLDEENKESNKKGYYKYFVAASVLILLGFFFTSQFSNTEGVMIDDTVVSVEKKEVGSPISKIVTAPVDSYFKNDVIKENSKEEKKYIVVNRLVNDDYIESLDVKEEESQEEEINSLKEKVNKYLVQLENSKQEKLNKERGEYDLDAEINALLAEASNNLPDEKVNNNLPVFQLDKETDMLLANAFQELNLNPAEDTINETLKNKLFRELEKGYFKSKMLLAERSQLTRP